MKTQTHHAVYKCTIMRVVLPILFILGIALLLLGYYLDNKVGEPFFITGAFIIPVLIVMFFTMARSNRHEASGGDFPLPSLPL